MRTLIFLIFYFCIDLYSQMQKSPSWEYYFQKLLFDLQTQWEFRLYIALFGTVVLSISVLYRYIEIIEKKIYPLIYGIYIIFISIISFYFFLDNLFRVELDKELFLYVIENWRILLPSISVLQEGNFLFLAIGMGFIIVMGFHYIQNYLWSRIFIFMISYSIGFGLLLLPLYSFWNGKKKHNSQKLYATTRFPEKIAQPEVDWFRVPSFYVKSHFKKKWGFSLVGSKRPNVVIFLLESVRKDAIQMERSRFFNETHSNSLVVKNFYIPIPHSSNTHFTILTGYYSPRKVHRYYKRIDKHNFMKKIKKQSFVHILKKYYSRIIYLTSNDLDFEFERNFLKFLNIEIIERKHLEKYHLKGFEWGIDDKSLLLKTQELLPELIEQPFFMLYVFSNSHVPYFNPHPDVYNQYDNRKRKERYFNVIQYNQDIIDQIVDEFKKNHLYKNTIFILLSDHGESFGEYGYVLHDSSLYNPEVLVPFVIHYSMFSYIYDYRKIPLGSLMDLVPTLLDMLEISTPYPYPGKSLFDPQYQLNLFLYVWGKSRKKGLLKDSYKWLYDLEENELQLLDYKDNVIQEIFLSRTDPVLQHLKYWEPFKDFLKN